VVRNQAHTYACKGELRERNESFILAKTNLAGLDSRAVPKTRITILLLLALLAAACESTKPEASPTIPASLPPAVAKTTPSPLACSAKALRGRARDHTTVGIDVRTTAHAWVTATNSQSLDGSKVAGRADAAGQRRLRFSVGDVMPGTRVIVDVRVSQHGKKAHCRASFRVRPAAVVVAPPAPSTAASPPAPSTAAPPPAPGTSCHPLSDEGTCYEPGEFCRDSDHGVTGLAGDGEQITCEDNDGWRWEPT
jgi:hypothetical protein